ncbi:hypothetical protein LLB_2104 [Legionella longbeachae D-4968]|nr:hypothetical protein LLB_2104 [Legionella longbeachae D-4968]
MQTLTPIVSVHFLVKYGAHRLDKSNFSQDQLNLQFSSFEKIK